MWTDRLLDLFTKQEVWDDRLRILPIIMESTLVSWPELMNRQRQTDRERFNKHSEKSDKLRFKPERTENHGWKFLIKIEEAVCLSYKLTVSDLLRISEQLTTAAHKKIAKARWRHISKSDGSLKDSRITTSDLAFFSGLVDILVFWFSDSLTFTSRVFGKLNCSSLRRV